ncbi:MAG TPA: trans-aconitate 2-methyltransferase [Humibacter sp.]|nr:trans-aconitate 2-methyltransferase [Humibacter sp.]
MTSASNAGACADRRLQWDPARYGSYTSERARPFFDLLARVGADAPEHVVDLGCGTGELTATLAGRWPRAQVTGIDSSAQMLAAAGPTAEAFGSGRLRFELADIVTWRGAGVADVIVSNAVLQWVPEHRELLRGWAAAMPAEAWLAFQVPGNFAAPSHRLMRELAAMPRWRDKLDGVLRHEDAVDDPDAYLRLLHRAGLSGEAWETTYLHVLHGADPVLEWVRGTALRPVLQALTPAEAARFEAEYGALLRDAYPRTDHGTVFPFRRVFAVGHRPSQ